MPIRFKDAILVVAKMIVNKNIVYCYHYECNRKQTKIEVRFLFQKNKIALRLVLGDEKQPLHPLAIIELYCQILSKPQKMWTLTPQKINGHPIRSSRPR